MGPIRPSINRLTYPSDYESDFTSRETSPDRKSKLSKGQYLGFGPILLNTAPAASYTPPKPQQPQQRYQGPGPTPAPIFKASSLPPETSKPVMVQQPTMNGTDSAPQPRGKGVKNVAKIFNAGAAPPPMPPSIPGVAAFTKAPTNFAPPAAAVASPITSPEAAPNMSRVKPASPKMKKKTESS